MHFEHAAEIWRDFPELAAGVVVADGITSTVSVEARIAELAAIAGRRLADGTEADLPEIQAWRRAFARMGLKPTQYRCASEALLRRYRKEGALPPIHPLVDLCNAISLAHAIPVAAFDVAEVDGHLEVRYAAGSETYLAFSGEIEHPQPGEVVFADAGGRAHARRWTNRQSALSALRAETAAVVIVAEAMHETGRTDVERLTATIAEDIAAAWAATPSVALLGAQAPRFAF